MPSGCDCAECRAEQKAVLSGPQWSRSCADWESCFCGCLQCVANVHTCGHLRECHIGCREGVLVPA